MKINYTIAALLFALSCGPEKTAEPYVEVGRLNVPGDAWEPAAVAVAPDGRIYVADSSLNGAVQVFDPAGLYIGGIGGLGKAPGELFVPTDVAVGRDGKIYVAEFGTRRVSVFGPDGRFARTVGEGVLAAPFGVAAGPGGTIYVSDAEAGGLLIFSPEGALLEVWGEEPDTGPILDVAVAADGGVALAPGPTGEVLFYSGYDRKLTPLTASEDGTFTATEVTFGPEGNFFILGMRTGARGAQEYCVAKLAADGRLIGEIELPLTSPAGLAVAPDGTVYVADGSRHEVKIYRP
ncbi:MAG: 6-bladed beta-propeller [candidate division Zixibacteria bacterium]|nr:6-bladed beta-propeller [candidate division Zixibacteria bacterium]